MLSQDSQKIKIKKNTKTPRITDEGGNSQKQLSGPVEKNMKERVESLALQEPLSTTHAAYNPG